MARSACVSSDASDAESVGRGRSVGAVVVGAVVVGAAVVGAVEEAEVDVVEGSEVEGETEMVVCSAWAGASRDGVVSSTPLQAEMIRARARADREGRPIRTRAG